LGAKELLNRLFPNMEITPTEGFNYALQFDCDAIPGDPTQFLNTVSELKRHISGGPLDRAFEALLAKKSESLPRVSVEYRKGESMFVCPAASKVVVIYQIDFADLTDRALARVFLQEFVEAQRAVRTAPPVNFSKEPPGELAGLPVALKNETAGFISFARRNATSAATARTRPSRCSQASAATCTTTSSARRPTSTCACARGWRGGCWS
jgi:hypothetical protein